jgi:hypothetical protein
MSLPPRFAAGAVPTAVNDIAALALEEPAHGAPAREDVPRTLREDRTVARGVGWSLLVGTVDAGYLNMSRVGLASAKQS